MTSINGQTFSGSGNVSIINGQVFVNGRLQGGGDTIRGNNQVADESREVTDRFTRVEASGVDQLNVVCGSDKRGLELHGESNILSEIESRVDDNGTMHIGFKSGSYQPNSPVAATLFMDAPLRELELSGSTAGTVENVNSDKLNIDLSGSSSATVKGQAEDLNLDISGSARFDGQWLIAQDASVDASRSRPRVNSTSTHPEPPTFLTLAPPP